MFLCRNCYRFHWRSLTGSKGGEQSLELSGKHKMAFFGGEADEIKKLKRQIGTQGERGCGILTFFVAAADADFI